MKVKILRGDRGMWYWNTNNIGKEFEISKYTFDIIYKFKTKDGYYIHRDDVVITELPVSFCVKKCDDDVRWKKYVNWLKKKYNRVINDYQRFPYYGNEHDHSIGKYISFGTEIHIDDIIKHIDFYSEPMPVESEEEEKVMEKQKLSRQGLKEIHSVVCSAWKMNLERYGANNPLEDYIELTQEQVDNIFNACTKEQLPIVSKYLKQDDGSVDLRKYDSCQFINKRIGGEYKYKAFWLTTDYDWQIGFDSEDELCLIPTKKK